MELEGDQWQLGMRKHGTVCCAFAIRRRKRLRATIFGHWYESGTCALARLHAPLISL